MTIVRFFRRYPLVVLAVVSLATVLGLLAAGREELAQILATAVIILVVLITAWGMVNAVRAGSWGLGEAIEEHAANRAGRELDALLDRPRSFANWVDAEGAVVRVPSPRWWSVTSSSSARQKSCRSTEWWSATMPRSTNRR